MHKAYPVDAVYQSTFFPLSLSLACSICFSKQLCSSLIQGPWYITDTMYVYGSTAVAQGRMYHGRSITRFVRRDEAPCSCFSSSNCRLPRSIYNPEFKDTCRPQRRSTTELVSLLITWNHLKSKLQLLRGIRVDPKTIMIIVVQVVKMTSCRLHRVVSSCLVDASMRVRITLSLSLYTFGKCFE